MKSTGWIIAVLGLAAAVAAYALLHRTERGEKEATLHVSPAVRDASSPPALSPMVETSWPEAGDATAASVGPAHPGSAVVAIPAEAAAVATAKAPVRISVNEVLATVNGAAITLGDLMPARPGEGEQSMSAEDYAYWLNDAIRRQLIHQVARARGIVLSETQRASVSAIRARHAADLASFRQQGLTWTSVTKEQIDFEVGRAEAILLEQNLLAREGCPPLQPSQEQVEAYYAAHRGEYGELPADPAQRAAAWQKIHQAIRQKLDPEYVSAYLACQDRKLAELKAGMSVVVIKPPPS